MSIRNFSALLFLVSLFPLSAQASRFDDQLLTAASQGLTATLRVSLKKGANINVQGEGGRTPLMTAVFYRKSSAVKVILKFNPDLNVFDTINHRTAIYYAIQRNRSDFVEEFLQKGADVLVKDNKGNTPLDFARILHKKKIVSILEVVTQEAEAERAQFEADARAKAEAQKAADEAQRRQEIASAVSAAVEQARAEGRLEGRAEALEEMKARRKMESELRSDLLSKELERAREEGIVQGKKEALAEMEIKEAVAKNARGKALAEAIANARAEGKAEAIAEMKKENP